MNHAKHLHMLVGKAPVYAEWMELRGLFVVRLRSGKEKHDTSEEPEQHAYNDKENSK